MEGYHPSPEQLEMVQRAEREATLRLAEAREQLRSGDGEVPAERHGRLRRLPAQWRQVLARLHHARGGAPRRR